MTHSHILNREEKAILSAYKTGLLKRSKSADADMKKLQEAARAHYGEPKTLSITLRMSPGDVSRLKSRAAKRGIKYQTLLTALTKQFLDKEIEVKL